MLATAGLPINQPKPGAKQENSKTLLGVKKKSVVFDDRTHSLFPPGVPYQARETIKFVYNWDKTKGKERHVRDPVKKPKARPLDDMYLGAMKPTTSDSAWEHLDVEKQRYSLGDYNEFIKPTKRIPKPRPQPAVADTQTDNEVISPTESLPIIVPKPSPPEPVQEKPQKKIRRVPRPPWRDAEFCKYEFPVPKEKSEEYWTLDQRENFCCPPLPLLDQCKVSMRSTRRDHCRAKSINPETEKCDSRYRKIGVGPGNPCCAHPCFTTVPGRIRRLLSWAPCTPIPRTLLLCQHCGAAFCGKYERRQGRYEALVEFCGYAVIDKEGVISFNLYNPDDEHLPEPAEPPKRVKCSCQRCRSRMSQRKGDHFPDCECSLCKRRLLKCLNQNYYAWLDKKNNSNPESDPDVNEIQDELIEAFEAEKPMKDCKLPECLCRDQKPGEPLKDCECGISKDQKAKCMGYILNFGSASQLELPTLLGSKPKPEIPTNSDNKNPRKVSQGSLESDKSWKKKIAYDNDSTENKEVDPTAKVESKPVATPDIRESRETSESESSVQTDELRAISVSTVEPIKNTRKSSIEIENRKTEKRKSSKEDINLSQ